MLAPAPPVRSPAAITPISGWKHVSRESANVSAVLGNGAQDIDGVTVEQLVALADGSLPPERRDEVAQRVAASPQATEALELQRRALAATRAFAPPTPPGLHGALRAPQRTRAVRLRPALAAACVLLALALVAGLALSRQSDPLAVAVDVSGREAREPAPPARGATLRRTFEGVTFPDWEREFGWRATGARRDTVDERASDTVYYQHTHHRIGYTVLAGRSVGLPSKGRRVVRDGVQIQLYHAGARTVAVFERGGRTCVLAGVVHRDSTLVKLAAWRA